MIGGCDLCKKIWDNVDEYLAEHGLGKKPAIVMEDGEPWLYLLIDGWYYNGKYLQLNFCPKCGRQINPDYKAMR